MIRAKTAVFWNGGTCACKFGCGCTPGYGTAYALLRYFPRTVPLGCLHAKIKASARMADIAAQILGFPVDRRRFWEQEGLKDPSPCCYSVQRSHSLLGDCWVAALLG